MKIFPCAASDAAGEVSLHLSYPSRSGHSVFVYEGRESGGTQSVATARLDDLVGELQPDIVKLDIEGGEALALKGMGKILADKRLSAVFIECNREWLEMQKSSADELLSPLKKAGFACAAIEGDNYLCVRRPG